MHALNRSSIDSKEKAMLHVCLSACSIAFDNHSALSWICEPTRIHPERQLSFLCEFNSRQTVACWRIVISTQNNTGESTHTLFTLESNCEMQEKFCSSFHHCWGWLDLCGRRINCAIQREIWSIYYCRIRIWWQVHPSIFVFDQLQNGEGKERQDITHHISGFVKSSLILYYMRKAGINESGDD